MDNTSILCYRNVGVYVRCLRSRMGIPTEEIPEASRRLFVYLIIPLMDVSCRNFGMAAAMFMNSNSLPIALMQSLVLTVPGLKWGEDDNKDAMLGRALTYLVLYSTLGMVVSVGLL